VDYSVWLPVQRRMVDHVLNEELRFKKRDRGEMDLLKFRLAEDDIKRNKDELKKLEKKLKSLQKGNDLRQYICYPDSSMAAKVFGELPEKKQKSMGNQFQRPPAKSNDRVQFKPKPKPKPKPAQGKPRKPPASRQERPRSIERCCDAIAAMAKGEQQPRGSSLSREDSLPPPNYSWPTFFAAFAQGIFARSSIGNIDDIKEPPVKLPKRTEHDFFGVEPPRKKSNPSRNNSNPSRKNSNPSRKNSNRTPSREIVENIQEISVVENHVRAVNAEPGGNFNETVLIDDNNDQFEVGSANSVVSSNIRIQLEDSDDQSKVLKEHCVSYKGPVSLTLIIGPVNGAKTVKQVL